MRVLAQLGGVDGLASGAEQAITALGLGEVRLEDQLLDSDVGLEGQIPRGPDPPEPSGPEDPLKPVPAAYQQALRPLRHGAPLSHH